MISPNALGLLYAVSEVALSLLKRSQPGAASKDTTFKLIWAVMPTTAVALLVIAALLPAARLPYADAMYFAGLAIFLFGLFVRFGSVVQLGRFFTVDVQVASDQRVIDTGFYRYVRHPSYAGVVITFVGLGISTGNWLSILVGAIPPFLALRARIEVEERALAEGLGEPYRDYLKRTKRLLPFVY